jgi:hypothetical protein
VRRLAIADQPRHVAHRDRGLLHQKLRGSSHSSRQQILTKGRLPELGVGACYLPR